MLHPSENRYIIENSRNLDLLGWNRFFSGHSPSYLESGYTVGRVALEHKTTYILYTEFGELTAEVAGKIRHQTTGRLDFPAVGDWGAISVRHEEHKATIHEISSRKSKFSWEISGALTQGKLLPLTLIQY
ncbi:MAG TPA: hypothetical protein V6D50_19150 [Chroococcales cyanobacterium]